MPELNRQEALDALQQARQDAYLAGKSHLAAKLEGVTTMLTDALQDQARLRKLVGLAARVSLDGEAWGEAAIHTDKTGDEDPWRIYVRPKLATAYGSEKYPTAETAYEAIDKVPAEAILQDLTDESGRLRT